MRITQAATSRARECLSANVPAAAYTSIIGSVRSPLLVARLTSGMSAGSNKLTSVIYIKMMHVILYVKLNLAINLER